VIGFWSQRRQSPPKVCAACHGNGWRYNPDLPVTLAAPPDGQAERAALINPQGLSWIVLCTACGGSGEEAKR
jgi:DnaJ-class molecular chaperone